MNLINNIIGPLENGSEVSPTLKTIAFKLNTNKSNTGSMPIGNNSGVVTPIRGKEIPFNQ